MFIRSENLFFRPAWPEDRANLTKLDVPSRHDPLAAAQNGRGLVITMPASTPGARGAKLIGTAGFRKARRQWEPQVWLAPAWRHLGLFDEAEDTIAQLAENLPPCGGEGVVRPCPPIAA